MARQTAQYQNARKLSQVEAGCTAFGALGCEWSMEWAQQSPRYTGYDESTRVYACTPVSVYLWKIHWKHLYSNHMTYRVSECGPVEYQHLQDGLEYGW